MKLFKQSVNKVKAGKAPFKLNKRNAWLLWCCQCLNIALIATELSHWMLAVIILSLFWQALLLNKRFKRADIKQLGKPQGAVASESGHRSNNLTKDKIKNRRKNKTTNNVSSIFLGIFALLGCLAIVLTAKQAGVLTSMLHLLCFSYAIKAFELKSRGDFYQLILLGIFVLASSLIFRQDLLFSFITIVILVVNLAVLLHFYSNGKALVTDIKVVGILLAQSTVLAVVLFLFFPRIAPFWQVPIAKSAETGLSDQVQPGDIANLSRSTKLAFRADFFEQAPPAYSQRYWRAMVMENYDGRKWTRTQNRNGEKQQNVEFLNEISTKPKKELEGSIPVDIKAGDVKAGDVIGGVKSSVEASTEVNNEANLALNYQVIVEASFQKYLFALAPAISPKTEQGINANPDYTFTSKKIISQPKSYQLTSYLSAPLSLNLSNESRNNNLAYPHGSNPKLEALGKQLAQDYPEPQRRANAILSIINKERYAYTLQPPLLSNNSLDQFFFDTKAGFCVHYASSFTFLMRASGIPARLVTGYLGGEYNTSGQSSAQSDLDDNSDDKSSGHLSVYQYDAHAWSEIWVKDKGWLRVDPTGAVDPKRVNSGWSDELIQQQSSLNNDLFSLRQMKNIAWLNSLRLQFDALDYQWTRWVIGFNSEQQFNLFKRLFGEMASWKLTLIIGVSLILSMGTLFILLHWLNSTKQAVKLKSQWQLIYDKALSRLNKEGLIKPKDMTVNDFTNKIQTEHPEISIAFARLSDSYSYLCYQALSVDERKVRVTKMELQYKQFIQSVNKASRR